MTPLSGAEVEYWILPRLRRIPPAQASKLAPRGSRKHGIADCVFFPYITIIRLEQDGVERANSHDRWRKLQLYFGNVAGYYRSGCPDIKAASANLATGSL